MLKSLETLSKKRADLQLPDFRTDSTIQQSFSSDIYTSETSEAIQQVVSADQRRDYQRKWLGAENTQAQAVDLMKIVGEYTKTQIDEIILPNLHQIEMTTGCTGGCYFCYSAPQKQISQYVDISSFTHFAETYTSQIDPFLILYGGKSDPFDYNFGEHTILAALQALREHSPKRSMYISTVIPKGSQRLFIDTIQWMFSTSQEETSQGIFPWEIRISISEQNIQRVEAVFAELQKNLIAEGYSLDSISNFFETYFDFSYRFQDQVVRLGKSIGSHDDYKAGWSPSCSDHLGVRPDGFFHQKVVGANKYYAAGSIEKRGIPDQSFVFAHMDEYNFSNGAHVRQVFLSSDPVAETYDTEILTSAIARELKVLDLMRMNFSPSIIASIQSDDRQAQYMNDVNNSHQEFQEKIPEIESLLLKTKQHIESIGEGPETEKLQYLLKLLTFYYKKLSAIFDFGNTNTPHIRIHEGIAFGSFISELGEDQVERFDQIIQKTDVNLNQLFNRDSQIVREDFKNIRDIAQKLHSNLCDFFQQTDAIDWEKIDNYDTFHDIAPAWLYYITMSYQSRLFILEDA